MVFRAQLGLTEALIVLVISMLGASVVSMLGASPAAAVRCENVYFGYWEEKGTNNEFCRGLLTRQDSKWEESYSTASWLVSGAEIATLTSVEMQDELLLSDLKAPVVGEATVTCSLITEGSIGSKGENEITEILNLSGTSISARKLGGAGSESILCTAAKGCEASATETQAWPSKLSVPGVLEHMYDEQIWDFLEGGGWTILCLVLGVATEDECTGLTSTTMENMTEGVLGTFGKEPDNCQLGGAEAGVIEGTSIILTLTGLEVTVD